MRNHPRDAKANRTLSADGMRQLAHDNMTVQPGIPGMGSPVSTFAASGGLGGSIDTGNLMGAVIVKVTKYYLPSITEPVHYGFKQQVQNSTTGVWEDAITGLTIDGQTPAGSYGLTLDGMKFSVDDLCIAIRHPKDLNLWLLMPIPPQEFDAEITGNNGGTPVLYSWKKKTWNSSGSLVDAADGLTGTNNLYRNPSNTPSIGSGPPVIPNGQVVRIKSIVKKPGYWETDAVGGLQGVRLTDNDCNTGILTGRDLQWTADSPPPPPPPDTGAYYCVDGTLIYVPPDGATPPKSDCGPSSIKIDCDTCTPVGTGGGIGISDSTSYSDPYTTGDTQLLSLAKTGSFTGTPTWHIFVIDDALYGEVTPDTGTGNTFGPTIEMLAAGTVEFLVMLTDSGDPSKLALTTITRTVDPPVTPVRTGAGDLTLDDAFQLTKADTTGGGFTLTLDVSAAGLAKYWWTVKNVGSNTLTIDQTSGETINGAASITVAAGASVTLFPDNLNTWATA